MFHKIIVRGDTDHIYITPVHCLAELLLTRHPILLMSLAQLLAAGVDILFETRFGINYTHQSYCT